MWGHQEMLTERIRAGVGLEASAAGRITLLATSESRNRLLLSCLVAKSGLTVYTMDRSMPGLPVLRPP